MKNMETTTLSFLAKFPLIRCGSCGMEYVLIAVTGEDYAANNTFCPYCGKKKVSAIRKTRITQGG